MDLPAEMTTKCVCDDPERIPFQAWSYKLDGRRSLGCPRRDVEKKDRCGQKDGDVETGNLLNP